MKKLITTLCIAGLFLLFLNSCKHNKDEVPAPAPAAPTYDNYSNLRIGNYWVYRNYFLDTAGNVTSTGDMDSCYVEKDTMYNGHTYKKMVDVIILSYPAPTHTASYLLRDSLSYTVDGWGRIVFSSADFSGTFNSHYQVDIPLDTFALVYSNMLPGTESKVVPAGFFNTLDFRTTYHLYPHYSLYNHVLYTYSWYAKDVGLIAQRSPLSYLPSGSEEKRLIRYHLN